MTAVNPPKSLGVIVRSTFTLVDQQEIQIPRPHALVVTRDGNWVHAGSLASWIEPGALAIERRLADSAGSTVVSYDPNIRPFFLGDLLGLSTTFGLGAGHGDALEPASADADPTVALNPSAAPPTTGPEQPSAAPSPRLLRIRPCLSPFNLSRPCHLRDRTRAKPLTNQHDRGYTKGKQRETKDGISDRIGFA